MGSPRKLNASILNLIAGHKGRPEGHFSGVPRGENLKPFATLALIPPCDIVVSVGFTSEELLLFEPDVYRRQ
jgi:hypothetical protein